MGEKNNISDNVPYIVHEAELARQERQIKRLWIALLVSIILVFASNIAWIIYESLYDTITYAQDGGSINNINTGEQGNIYGTEVDDTQAKEQLGKPKNKN